MLFLVFFFTGPFNWFHLEYFLFTKLIFKKKFCRFFFEFFFDFFFEFFLKFHFLFDWFFPLVVPFLFSLWMMLFWAGISCFTISDGCVVITGASRRCGTSKVMLPGVTLSFFLLLPSGRFPAPGECLCEIQETVHIGSKNGHPSARYVCRPLCVCVSKYSAPAALFRVAAASNKPFNSLSYHKFSSPSPPPQC